MMTITAYWDANKAILQLLLSTLAIIALDWWAQGIEVEGMGIAFGVAAIRLIGYLLGGFTVLLFLPFFLEDCSIRFKWSAFFWTFNLCVFFINLFMLGGIAAFLEGFEMNQFTSVLQGTLIVTAVDLFTHSLGVKVHL
ncbi:phage holin family protein [Laceyella sacchari]